MIVVCLQLLVLSLFLNFISSNGFQFGQLGNMQIEIGKSSGFSASTSITQDTLQKIVKGAEHGNKESIYMYGLLKLYGTSVQQDSAVAATYFRKAADLGHIEAQTAYAVMLLSGNGIPSDYSLAVKYLRQSVAQNDPEAHWLLGVTLMEIISQKKDPIFGPESPSDAIARHNKKYAESLLLLKKAADEFHIAQAEYFLGMAYEYAIGVEQNFYVAQEYYRRATEKGHADSMYNLALMYTYGRGCVQDYRRAFAMFDNAIRSSSHKSAAYYLGLFHMYGYACEPNYDRALNWFEYASVSEDPTISEKALKAVVELREMIDLAKEETAKQLDSFREKGETIQASGASYNMED